MSNVSKAKQAERLAWPSQEGSHSGIQLRVDTELSHSIEKSGSVNTQAGCGSVSTTDTSFACVKRVYDFLALLPFILLSGSVDVRS